LFSAAAVQLGSRFFLLYNEDMNTEYEATFLNINKEALVEKLIAFDAELMRPEHLQRRVTFHLPKEKKDSNTWLRVRDEGGNVITMTLKSVEGRTISGQKEIEILVSNFEDSVALLESIGCERKSYQESKRETWIMDDVQITFDTWPFLSTYIEIEGATEDAVKKISRKLDFDYDEAIFDTVNSIYKRKYGKTLDELDEVILKSFTFDIQNPFL
jgi:adenylate cyclase class 2